MRADILISASDMNTMADGSPLPRQRMFEALSVDGVASAVAALLWRDGLEAAGRIRSGRRAQHVRHRPIRADVPGSLRSRRC